jgi:hypothetical protein
VVTALGAELRGFAEHTRSGWFITGAELRRYGKPHCALRQGRERAEHHHGWQRCGAGELREPLGKWLMTGMAQPGSVIRFIELFHALKIRLIDLFLFGSAMLRSLAEPVLRSFIIILHQEEVLA